MANAAASRGNPLATWQVGVQAGGAAHAVTALADASLTPAGSPGGWKATGERSCFTLDLLDTGASELPAGWYEIRGGLRSQGADRLSPSLYPTYADGAAGDTPIPLPEAGSDGRLQALVLFKYPVTHLAFCASHGPSRFVMADFALTRVSRFGALHRLLGPTALSPDGRFGRSIGFFANVLRGGMTNATDALYRGYRQRLVPTGADAYTDWVARFDTLSSERLEGLRIRGVELAGDGPLISILVPLYQTPEHWLRRCIESVLAQAYPKWQLCLVDDASPGERVMQIAQEYAATDSRINVVRRAENGHISKASNTAIELARGDFIALLDHDDELRPHALLEVVEAILRNPGAGLIYSDEDKVDEDGRRFDPYFKPDFDPDLLRSQNYICHFTTIRADLVRDVGGFRVGFEGSQDHDLILRCTEPLRADQVIHIPRVLYHWRAIPGSTALTRDAKDYASSAGARAVDGHLQRCHPGARVEELSHGHYRVHWPLPDVAPKVSLVIPTRDRVELLRMCVESILARTTYPDFELVVVDNQSTDTDALAYLAELQQRDRVKVLRFDAPFNYSAINNWAVAQCDGALIGLVNNDIEVISPDWLDEMVAHALRPEVGAVGAMLYYPNDIIQHAGVMLGLHGVAGHIYAGLPRGYPGHGGRARVAQSMSAITGACLLVRRDVFEQVGGLDEQLQVAFNDIDFCLRLREAGYRNIWTPFAELYHHESASRGSEDTEEKKQRFAGEVEFMQQRWGEWLPRDPAYNVNLSLTSLHCELSAPPRLAL